MMIFMFLTAKAADLTCANVQAMAKSGKTEAEIVAAIKGANIPPGDLECFRSSGLPVAVMVAAGQRIQEITPRPVSKPISLEEQEEEAPDSAPSGSEQYECALFPIWNSSMTIIPKADQSNAKTAPVTLPKGWVPVNGFLTESAFTGAQAVIMACRPVE